MSLHTRTKICCIQSVEEALLAISCGASAIGLVGPMPSGPGVIDDKTAAEIVSAVPSSIDTFLLTSETATDNILAHHRKVNSSTIQLVDEIDANALVKLRHALPKTKFVQVIHVMDAHSITQAAIVAPLVHAILLDSGNPNAKVKELGGTARTHDWDISKRIVASVGIPVYLAGGLNAMNVTKAMDAVNPYGLDICSGVRTNGKLDESKLRTYMNLVRAHNEQV